MSGLEMRHFILKPNGRDEHGNASRMALLAYAREIKNKDPELSKDLCAWVAQIQNEMGMGAEDY